MMTILQCETVKSPECFALARLKHSASITSKFLRKLLHLLYLQNRFQQAMKCA